MFSSPITIQSAVGLGFFIVSHSFKIFQSDIMSLLLLSLVLFSNHGSTTISCVWSTTNQQLFSGITFDKGGGESGFLHGTIWDELDAEFIGWGADVLGNLVAAVFTDERRVVLVSVTHLQVIIHAIVVVLHLKQSLKI